MSQKLLKRVEKLNRKYAPKKYSKITITWGDGTSWDVDMPVTKVTTKTER